MTSQDNDKLLDNSGEEENNILPDKKKIDEIIIYGVNAPKIDSTLGINP